MILEPPILRNYIKSLSDSVLVDQWASSLANVGINYHLNAEGNEIFVLEPLEICLQMFMKILLFLNLNNLNVSRIVVNVMNKVLMLLNLVKENQKYCLV